MSAHQGAAIAVVDSGGANLTSVLHALERLHADAVLTADPALIASADKVLLPGVGAAPRAMALMRERGLIDCIRARKKPVLGICLGMQLLFQRSEEGPVDCLGLLAGEVKKFDAASGLTIPQMGWNQVTRQISKKLDGRINRGSRLLEGIADGTNFYFVHSYRAELTAATTAVCDYGGPFTAIVEEGPFLGVQFHPERSGPAGARLLQNFLEL